MQRWAVGCDIHARARVQFRQSQYEAIFRKWEAPSNPLYHSVAASGKQKKGTTRCMHSWEAIPDDLRKAGWSLGWVSAINSEGEQSGGAAGDKRRL